MNPETSTDSMNTNDGLGGFFDDSIDKTKMVTQHHHQP